jgi:hypothetical protein
LDPWLDAWETDLAVFSKSLTFVPACFFPIDFLSSENREIVLLGARIGDLLLLRFLALGFKGLL